MLSPKSDIFYQHSDSEDWKLLKRVY
jgi:hypothetical protein